MTDDQFDKYFARNKLDTAQNFSFNETSGPGCLEY